MNTFTASSPGRRLITRVLPAVTIVALAGLVAFRNRKTDVRMVPACPERARSELQLRDNRLFDGERLFTGIVFERYADGVLRSRSSVSNGLLQGLSQGWHTNGQLQIAEQFVAGIAHGPRTKWYPNGAKLSEANIAGGQLNGSFHRWHENGTLAEQIEFLNGRPEGVSLAWFSSGRPKARVVARSGQTVERASWGDAGNGP